MRYALTLIIALYATSASAQDTCTLGKLTAECEILSEMALDWNIAKHVSTTSKSKQERALASKAAKTISALVSAGFDKGGAADKAWSAFEAHSGATITAIRAEHALAVAQNRVATAIEQLDEIADSAALRARNFQMHLMNNGIRYVR